VRVAGVGGHLGVGATEAAGMCGRYAVDIERA